MGVRRDISQAEPDPRDPGKGTGKVLLMLLNICCLWVLGYARLTGGALIPGRTPADAFSFFLVLLLAAWNIGRCSSGWAQYLRQRRYRALAEAAIAAIVLAGMAWAAYRIDPDNVDKVIRTLFPAVGGVFVLVVALAMSVREWRRGVERSQRGETNDSGTLGPSRHFVAACLLVGVAGIGLGTAVWFCKSCSEFCARWPWPAIATELLLAAVVPLVAIEALGNSYSLAGKRRRATILLLASAVLCGALAFWPVFN